MRYKIMFLLAVTMLFAITSSADEIMFLNGNVITGKIVKLTDGNLVFDSDVAGEITIGLSKIQTLSSNEAVVVNLKDGTSFYQRLNSAQAGRFAIQGNESISSQEFLVADILSINPPIKPLPKWTGDLSLSITSTHGNTKSDSVAGSANASKRTEKDRTTVSADYAKSTNVNDVTGQDETVEDWWRARAKYDYFFSKKMYGYLDTRYEKDAVAELDRRITVGIGGGYQWIESDEMNFSSEIGIASLYEKFDNQTDSNSEISLQLGYHFDKKLAKNIKFINDLTYYPALQKFSDYYLTTTGEIRTNFTEKFFANFKAILNYDASPAQGRHSTDTKYFLGLGYSF